MFVRRAAAAIVAVLVGGAGTLVALPGAGADSQVTNGAPYTCTTNGFGDQTATYSATVSDNVDPAAVGDSVTYRFVVPFAQSPPPVTATYKGSTLRYRIPAGLNVTGVSTGPPVGTFSASASVQGDTIVVTSTANQPIDGGTYPTPDLFVTGTIAPSAAGPGITWRVPYQIVANVQADIVGAVVATCAPDNPNIVIATTTVPAGPRPPVAFDQAIALPQSSSKAITLGASDPDTPASQLTFEIVTPPANGRLTGTAPAVTYTPNAGYAGPDSFVFRVRDPEGGVDTATVTINVFSLAVIDDAPPTISLTAPTNGAVYAPGQVVPAAFACADASTGIKSCTATTAAGAAIPTTVGQHTFTVNAVDNSNNLARVTVSYRVIDPARVAQPYNAVLPSSPATANQVPMDCGPLVAGEQNLPLAASAPTQVGRHRTATVRFQIGAGEVPALTTATNLRYTFAAPLNGDVQSASLVPGTGSNAPGASVAVAGGKVVLTIAGPIAGGTTAPASYTPPAVDMVVVASGNPTSQIVTRFERFEVRNTVGVVPTDRSCTGGDPADGETNPALTRTTIVDIVPPTVSLIEPVNGAVFFVGTARAASFSCADERSLGSCVGTVANGAAIDTATPGRKLFTVTATDAAGNTATRSVGYTVKTPTVTYTARFAAADQAEITAMAAYFGIPEANLAATGVALIRYLVALDPDAPANPLVPPPPNTGPVSYTATYTRAEEAAILDTAARFAVDGDTLHHAGIDLLRFLYRLR